jgi:hypothetical protein
MKRFAILLLIALVGGAALVWADSDDRGGNSFFTRLEGFQEVPAISSTGSGELRLRIGEDTIEYVLTYQDLEGTTTTASHVHLGQKSVNGGVMFFLCGGGGRPACTATSGTFTGTVTATDIIGPTAQGLAPMEFAEAVRAIRAGEGYVNVHTDKHPGGEIRGQIGNQGNQQ